MEKKLIPLEQFLKNHPSKISDSLIGLIQTITASAKIISGKVRIAGLADILGETGTTNVQGEEVKKLDVYANDIILDSLAKSGFCSVMASEENEDAIIVPAKNGKRGEFAVMIDPLDGSSNIDVNVSIGTIFSVYKSKTGTASDCLQKGTEQVASGYVVYGSSTMLILTTGNGVNGFTLDASKNEFYLSHPDIKIPKKGKIYSTNEGNCAEFSEGLKKYLDYIREEDKATGRPYSARYIGSLVADFHRNLLKGGIFIYPATAKAKKGKLRLLYECNPMSFIIEQAGGRSTDGQNRILEKQPTELHERTPFYIGSEENVKQTEEFIRKYDKVTVN